MIRETRPGDEDALFGLLLQSNNTRTIIREDFDRTIAGYLAGEQPAVVLFVVEDADSPGGLGGYALMSVVPLLVTNGPAAQLQEIVVDESARGRNYGTELVRAVEAECVRRGVTQLTVASRRAGGFYDRLGFHESAEYMRRFF